MGSKEDRETNEQTGVLCYKDEQKTGLSYGDCDCVSGSKEDCKEV